MSDVADFSTITESRQDEYLDLEKAKGGLAEHLSFSLLFFRQRYYVCLKVSDSTDGGEERPLGKSLFARNVTFAALSLQESLIIMIQTNQLFWRRKTAKVTVVEWLIFSQYRYKDNVFRPCTKMD